MISKVLKTPSADDVVKITEMFKKAIITLSVGFIVSLFLIPIGFQMNWETPLFVIIFGIINGMCFFGVCFFGFLYWLEKRDKNRNKRKEINDDNAIKIIELQIKLEKSKNKNIEEIEVKNFEEE